VINVKVKGVLNGKTIATWEIKLAFKESQTWKKPKQGALIK